MRESTKGASVEDHVRQLRRYKGEFVRDLAYAAVRLPAAWLAPGDATILALDPSALLDADQSIRFKELLDKGAGALSDAELLAILLRTGTRGRSALDLARDVL